MRENLTQGYPLPNKSSKYQWGLNVDISLIHAEA